MALGKMRTQISIISTTHTKDTEGFSTPQDSVLANVSAYKEERHGSEKWVKMAAFSNATALFRFRKIPKLTVDTTMYITDETGRYNIISAEDVRGRGMYVEVLAEKTEPSKGAG